LRTLRAKYVAGAADKFQYYYRTPSSREKVQKIETLRKINSQNHHRDVVA